jgi:methyl-accepting chemotaxis protein
MKWKDLKLRLKLAVGFGIILFLTALVGVIGIIGTRNLGDRTEKFVHVNAIASHIMEARAAEKEYLASPNEKALNDNINALEYIYQETKLLKDLFADDYNIEQMRTIEEKTQDYEKSFSRYIEAEKEKAKYMELMRESADSALAQAEAISEDEKRQLLRGSASGEYIRDKIEKAGDAETIMHDFLVARKAEKEIIITGDDKYYKEQAEYFNRTLELAENLLSRFIYTRNIEQGEKLITALKAYKTNFDSFIERLEAQQSASENLTENAIAALDVIKEAADDQNSKLLSEQRNAIALLIGLVILILIIGAGAAYFLSLAFSQPITKSVQFAQKVADGNYNATLEIDQKDEMGELAVALQAMLNSFKKSVTYAEKIAKGDLSNSESQISTNQNPLEKALRLMETKLTEVIANIKSGTESIASGSREISASSSQVASGANEQAASTEEVSASMEEMAANINQSTENARITEKIAAKSAVGIKKGNNSFKITVEAMREIAGKIKMISEIARKTDVLAINAAIEAARAGEHGKGFAVVANEIRKLAENSQEAATVIEDVVGSSVDVAEESDKILSALLPEVERTSDLVKEITNAGNEQNSGVNQINNAVQELTKVIQQNTSAADEMASEAKSMAAQARELEKTVAFFKIDSLTQNSAQNINIKESFEQIEDEMNNNEQSDSNKDYKKGSSIKLDDYDDKDDDDFETYS